MTDETQRALDIHFQSALRLYAQRLQRDNNDCPPHPYDPPPTDLSLAINRNNVLVVDGYVRSISESIRDIPPEICTLIKAFYPRSHLIKAIGWNHYGEMAIGHNKQMESFVSLTNFQTICDDCNDIHPGWKRFIVRNCFNELYCVGRNVENDLGIDFSPKPNEVNKFQKMKPLKNESCYAIFSGSFAFHSFILSSQRNLYAFGQNNSSQCGYKDTDYKTAEQKMTATPVLVGNCKELFDVEGISKICCGDNFSLFLTENGDLFSCGNNRFGSCGFPINDHKRKQFIDKPTPLELNTVKMRDVNCGGRHVICISSDHNVWCFGQNLFHQLGFGKLNANRYPDIMKNDSTDEADQVEMFDTGRPRMNPYFKDKTIVKTMCGFSHTLAIEDNGNGYFFGRNHKAQCGKYHDGDYHVFDTIQTPFLFQDIKSKETEAAMSDNANGDKAMDTLQPFKDIEIRDGSGGYEHTILITRDNQLIAFGGNASKQCCMPSGKLIVSPYFMDKKHMGLNENQEIERVICGIDTTLIVCSTV